MVDFAEVLRKAAKEAEQKKKTKTEESKRGLLFGSGLTKRVAQQAEKQHERVQQQVTALNENAATILKAHVDPSIMPSTMMDQALVLDEDQTRAIEGIATQQFSCLIGAAGTGKTTVTKAMIARKIESLPLIDLNRCRLPADQTDKPKMNVAVCFTAFTGKAVQNIKRALPKEYHELCDTIHGTLGYCPTIEEYQDKETGEWKERKVFRPTFTALNKLPYKLCIVDESSMVPIYLWNELLAALPEDCHIVLVGDINQLPPVQGRSVFGFAMSKWPTYALTKLHRQAEGDSIAVNAHRILNGLLPQNCDKQFVIHEVPDGSLKAFTYIQQVIQHLHKQGKFDPLRDALIVPKNKDNLGQLAFNEKLVYYFNPVKKVNDIPVNPRIVIKAGYKQVVYAVGDKVMLLNNERKLGLTNGMTGVVEEIAPNARYRGEEPGSSFQSEDFDLVMDFDAFTQQEFDTEEKIEEPEDENERAASHIMKVRFQNVDEPITLETAGSFSKIAHAYAFTCHKSQGGEYPTVVVVCHASDLRMLTREWLYTAITRAQERVILLCNARGLKHAVNSQRIKGTTIDEKIARFIALETDETVDKPKLPEPVEL